MNNNIPKDKNIVPGYNGIMDLDLTNIPKKYHQEMIKLHNQDIEDYKVEQAKRPSHLRYENSILRVENQLKIENELFQKRIKNKIN
jgi:hypothetical protein